MNPQNFPRLFYKSFLPVVSRNLEYEGELDRGYVRHHKQKLKKQWLLRDDGGNTHVVEYNMDENRPRLTTGWYQLRVFYDLEGNCTIWLHEVGDSIFHIEVLDQYGKEKQVPGGPPPSDSYTDDEVDKLDVFDFYPDFKFPPEASSSLFPRPAGFVEGDAEIEVVTDVETEPAEVQEGGDECVFNCRLTSQHYLGNQFPVPPTAATYLKNYGVQSWIFIGPDQYPGEFRVHVLPNSGVAKIGRGLRQFCNYNDISQTDQLRFRFSNAMDQIVHVDKFEAI